MNVEIKYGNTIKNFEDKSTIIIGNGLESDFSSDVFTPDMEIKLIYSEKYKNYVLINVNNSKEILLNNRTFSKVLVPAHFSLSIEGSSEPMLINISDNQQGNAESSQYETNVTNSTTERVATKMNTMKDTNDIFNNPIENNRIAIVKEIGYKIQGLKSSISSLGMTSFIMNIATVVLSVVCSFGVTNFLLGLKVDNSESVMNLTTNFGFLVCISAIVLAMSFILKHATYSLLEAGQNKRLGTDNNVVPKMILYTSIAFMFVIYILNLFYYKAIPGMAAASLFISLLFVGALTAVAVVGGYFKYQLKSLNYQLMTSEYREDFETVLKGYRGLISKYINSLSQNRIANIKNNLVNCQMRMVVEGAIGLLTAPFLAYGVSNTLAACFPEAAGWVRVSGLRFSPIFLVLATFLIIFAFLSFVTAFTCSKRIKGSEIIKYDGFNDYANHGVNILGVDAIKSLNKEKNIVLCIACFIIMIEFTMNVSYFIQEIGGDIQGMFLSCVAALVPTALLIAETHLLSSTMHKIGNYNEVLAALD